MRDAAQVWGIGTRDTEDRLREIVDNRDAFTIEIGTVYGPPPTRNDVPDGVRMTSAEPMPGVVSVWVCGGAGG